MPIWERGRLLVEKHGRIEQLGRLERQFYALPEGHWNRPILEVAIDAIRGRLHEIGRQMEELTRRG